MLISMCVFFSSRCESRHSIDLESCGCSHDANNPNRVFPRSHVVEKNYIKQLIPCLLFGAAKNIGANVERS